MDGEEGRYVSAVILFVYGLTGAFVDVAAQLRGGVVHRARRAGAREAAQRVVALPAMAVLRTIATNSITFKVPTFQCIVLG